VSEVGGLGVVAGCLVTSRPKSHSNRAEGNIALAGRRRRERIVPQEYEQSQTIDAPPEEVFAWLSDVANLPEFLPPVVASSAEEPSVEGVPGQRIRTTLEYPGQEEGRTFDAEGGSEVVVHLSFGEHSVAPEMQERAPQGRDPLAEGISATLESIRRQIEEGSGKVKTPLPPEGVEPHPETNPAVVNEDPRRE
jgi:hypothetical protein